jgi:hypothetical protein
MKIKVSVKRRFRISGKGDSSPEKMPADVRATPRNATGNPDVLSGGTQSESSKIVFNGVEYDSIDDMPTYARNLYEQSVEASRAATQDAPIEQRRPGPKPIAAEPSFSPKSAVALFALIAFALLLYYLFSSR